MKLNFLEKIFIKNYVTVFVICILFWLLLFPVTIHYYQQNHEIEIVYNPSFDETSSDFIGLPGNIEKFIEQNKKNPKMNPFELSIFIYSFIMLGLSISNEKNLHKLFPFVFIIFNSVLNLYLCSAYIALLLSVDVVLKDYNMEFMFVGGLPIILLSYQFFRYLFKFFTKIEPKIVGKLELFSDPLNFLFTLLFVASGVFISFYVDLITLTVNLLK
ncbi:MAG: hypothetical protein JW982_11565 [Spirochaetes bacterium]|nr:hypothetical protein [Spirochaetota bacterium]